MKKFLVLLAVAFSSCNNNERYIVQQDIKNTNEEYDVHTYLWDSKGRIIVGSWTSYGIDSLKIDSVIIVQNKLANRYKLRLKVN